MIERLVDEILSHMDAEPRISASIRLRLVPSLEEQRITDPNEIYRRVTNWIDASRVSKREKYFVRIDDAFEDGGLKTFRDAKALNPLETLLEQEENNNPDALSFDGLMDLMAAEISPRYLPLLTLLFHQNREVFGDRRYNKDKVVASVPEIEKRIELAMERFHEGRLLVPRKRVVSVTFDTKVTFHFASGYPDNVVKQVLTLLRQGASYHAAGRIVGVSLETVRRWGQGFGPTAKMSSAYPRFSEFSVARLTEAKERSMTVEEAARYSGLDRRKVVSFFRVIGHNYLTLQHEERISYGIQVGANLNQILRYARIGEWDLKHYLRIKNMQLKPYNPSNPLALEYFKQRKIERMRTEIIRIERIRKPREKVIAIFNSTGQAYQYPQARKNYGSSTASNNTQVLSVN